MKIVLRVEGSPRRIDQALLDELKRSSPMLSRSQLKIWFRDGKIHLHGERKPAQAARLLTPGTHTVEIADWDPVRAGEIVAATSEECFLPVIYENDSLLVLDKAAGIPSIPHSPEETHTAVGAALAHWPALAGIGRGGLEPGILHRLDNSTSGLLVFAKTESAFKQLSNAWKRREVRKTYRALCAHPVKHQQFPITSPKILPMRITAPLGHDAKSSRRMRVAASGSGDDRAIRGKALEAITIIEAISSRGDIADVTVSIETGVMHQIRAHLAHVGLPLLGDTLYGGPESSRIWLHAWKLEIPSAEGALKLEAPLPEDWNLSLGK